MKEYLNNFIIYSIFGYIIETLLKILFFPSMNNGFLYGPWIPIYGLGVCIIIFIMRLVFNRIKVKRFMKILLVFIISALILTLLELIGGHLIEFFTKKVFWDYSKFKFNIGHYIAIEISTLWGVMSIIIIYVLKPLTDKLIKKMPSIITYLVFLIITFDFSLSFINKL